MAQHRSPRKLGLLGSDAGRPCTRCRPVSGRAVGRHPDRRLLVGAPPDSEEQVHEDHAMTSLKLRYLVPIALVLLAGGAFLATRSHSEASTTVQALSEDTHFHGIAI